MKILVSSNCATTGFFNFCKLAFPDADVRSVLQSQSAVWVTEAKPAYLDFVRSADLLICSDVARRPLSGLIKSDCVVVECPYFVFMGHRPDCFWLTGVRSPTGAGQIHSRIVASAFAVGKSEPEAAALFCSDHFERLSYVSGVQRSVADLTDAFARSGVAIGPAFDRWLASGDFMYTPNHPHTQVFFDIMMIALCDAGLITPSQRATLEPLRNSFPDELARSIIWPVYPELVAAFGLSNPQTHWRSMLNANGQGQTFDLGQIIARSYQTYRDTENAAALITTTLGGAEQVARYANA